MSNLIADQVVSLVHIPDVLEMYGFKSGRKNRIPCPIHNGKDANFAYTNEVFHCWTCGAKGNVISLVMQMFNLSFGQAIIKINSDFVLGLSSKKLSYRESIAVRNRRRKRELERQKKEAKKEIYDYFTDVYRVYNNYLVDMDVINGKELYLRIGTFVCNLDDWLDSHVGWIRGG